MLVYLISDPLALPCLLLRLHLCLRVWASFPWSPLTIPGGYIFSPLISGSLLGVNTHDTILQLCPTSQGGVTCLTQAWDMTLLLVHVNSQQSDKQEFVIILTLGRLSCA